METKNKITVIVIGIVISVMSLMSCKTKFSPEPYQKSDCYDIEVVEWTEGCRLEVPYFRYKLPKKLFKEGIGERAAALNQLKDNQYVFIVYEPYKFRYCRYDSLDFDGLMCILESEFVYEDYRYYSEVKNIPQRIMKAESNNRINHIFRKDGFVIGLLNFLPKNKDSITKLIEESFTVKYALYPEYEDTLIIGNNQIIL
ncbi:MAG: hypothetical protein Q4F07_07760 [Bacteroidales bacterium]|nr:hypothetical protein [Bacteroidales bacterium]